MKQDSCRAPERRVRSLQEIDPALVCAVVWAEDRRFFFHQGVDWRALEGAAKVNWQRRKFRFGGSTITMQLARNLLYSRRRTPSRKLKELWVAGRIEAQYDKQTILELYLNSVEWAPCIYGVEAAAQHYFGHDARHLGLSRATLLAVLLPRPRASVDSSSPAREILEMGQQRLLTLMWRSGLVDRDRLALARRAVILGWKSGWVSADPPLASGGDAQWLLRQCASRASGNLP